MLACMHDNHRSGSRRQQKAAACRTLKGYMPSCLHNTSAHHVNPSFGHVNLNKLHSHIFPSPGVGGKGGGTQPKGQGPDLGSDKGRSHILDLQDGQAGQLLVDALEDVVVQVPGLMQLRLLAAAPVLVAPLIRFRQLMPICLQQTRHGW